MAHEPSTRTDDPRGNEWSELHCIRISRAAAVADLKAEVAKLSLEIAEKLVRQELKDDENQQTLIGRMISDSKLN